MILIDEPDKNGWAHMTSDSVEELHQFAIGLGMRRDWFQDKENRPHYDVKGQGMYKKAVVGGAKEVTRRELVKFLQEHYDGHPFEEVEEEPTLESKGEVVHAIRVEGRKQDDGSYTVILRQEIGDIQLAPSEMAPIIGDAMLAVILNAEKVEGIPLADSLRTTISYLEESLFGVDEELKILDIKIKDEDIGKVIKE